MSREEAIEILKNSTMKDTLSEQWQEAYKMAISALEQEPCDDAISRDAVLKVIDGWYEQNRDTENIEDLIILITYMGNVQPQTVCDDVVSRAEVKRIVDFYKEQYDGIYHINESIDKLPSVQPSRKGHCKDCKYFEYDSVANVDGVPLIVAHEICSKWGDGCKTREDGYCFLFESADMRGDTDADSD